MAKKQTKGYPWKYCSLGGVVRVNITSGEDIAHLGELDQKLWTVLSCPTKDLAFDERTLQLIDADGDGRVRVQEVVAAAEWLTAVVKDKDAILNNINNASNKQQAIEEMCDIYPQLEKDILPQIRRAEIYVNEPVQKTITKTIRVKVEK